MGGTIATREAVLEAILRTGLADGRSVSIDDGSPIPAHEGHFLQELVRKIHPSACIEIGLGFGVSALFIREALEPKARYIAIDPYQNQGYHNVGLNNLRRAGYSVEFYEDTSQAVLPRLWQDNILIDFAFIDGEHTFDHVLLDFWYVDKMLRPGGVIAFDDADLDSIYRVVRFALTNRAYRVFGQCPPTPPARTRSGPLQPTAYVRRFLKAGLVRLMPPRLLRAELARSDVSLGLRRHRDRCVAVVKLRNDRRDSNFHRDF